MALVVPAPSACQSSKVIAREAQRMAPLVPVPVVPSLHVRTCHCRLCRSYFSYSPLPLPHSARFT